MADDLIYVDIGPMSYSKDEKKAPKKYAEKAKAALAKAATTALGKDKAFTTKDADKNKPGYTLRLKVAELTIEGKTATCKLTGELLRYPKNEMLSSSLTGGANATGNVDWAAIECVDAAAEAMVTRNVVPVMKAQRR